MRTSEAGWTPFHSVLCRLPPAGSLKRELPNSLLFRQVQAKGSPKKGCLSRKLLVEGSVVQYRGVWGDGVGQNWVVFSGFPHRGAASGLDGTGPFLALLQGLAGQDSGVR